MSCAEGNGPPLLLAGYWADAADDEDRQYSVYRCRDTHECPGNLRAGQCAKNREGIGCASCVAGTVPDSESGECTGCGDASWYPVATAVAVGVGVLFSLCVYTLVDISRTNLNSVAVGICLGQMVVAVQAMSVLSTVEVRLSNTSASQSRETATQQAQHGPQRQRHGRGLGKGKGKGKGKGNSVWHPTQPHPTHIERTHSSCTHVARNTRTHRRVSVFRHSVHAHLSLSLSSHSILQ